jgi:DNA-binding PadR family transcriptional regulator
MEKKLLLLGMLRMQQMHGYQLNDFIDAHMGASVQLTRPTAYHLLKQMAEDGWISFTEEQEGNRPPRRVYAITPAGEEAFQNLLRQCLADYVPAEFKSDIALLFLEMIPPPEAIQLLEKRRKIIEEMLESMQDHSEEHHAGGFRFLIERQKHSLKSEIAWVDEVIAGLKNGAAQ